MVHDSKGYYKILGISAGSDIKDVKTAYRKKQGQLHPNGPERKKMRASAEYQKLSEEGKKAKEKELDELISKINVAYSVLGDAEKKKDYDNGVEDFGGFGGAEGFGNFEDIFSAFMGGGQRPQQREKKVADTITSVKITINESYTGKTSKFKIQTTRVCEPCKGKGYSQIKTCSQCKGNGRVYIQRQMGMMITRTEAECTSCNGQGTKGEGPACTKCKGAKIYRSPYVIEVNIKAGIKNNEYITFTGQGNHEPGKKPGDLVFKICVEPSQKYRRVNEDLIADVDVDLFTVLTGGIIYFDHLDKRKLAVKIAPIENLKSSVKLYGEGFKGNRANGHLYLNLNILINKNINKADLSKVLHPLIHKPSGDFSNISGSYSTLPAAHYEGRNESVNDEESEERFDARNFFRGGFSFF
ncbi:hypothetical protein NUSPORA_02169 [Nucleospora cyclopteri]